MGAEGGTMTQNVAAEVTIDTMILQLARVAAKTHAPLLSVQAALRREYLEAMLAEARGNKCKAARMAGMHRNTFNRLLSLPEGCGYFSKAKAQ
jgi:DNA-binding NtrC family response regulator